MVLLVTIIKITIYPVRHANTHIHKHTHTHTHSLSLSLSLSLSYFCGVLNMTVIHPWKQNWCPGSKPGRGCLLFISRKKTLGKE